MTAPTFSFEVNLGQLLVTGAITVLGWGLRKLYKFALQSIARVERFIEHVHENEDLLHATTAVVDEHTQVLIDADLLKPPVIVLHRRKRVGDRAVFTGKDQTK